jgi:hypothetical protein
MSRGTGKSRAGRERYVWLRHWLIDSPAWKSLSGGARALYIELARRYNGSNNGRIPYSVREAVEALHISPATASRLLKMLEDRGFIVCTRKGAFSLKTTRDASTWLLTEYDSDAPVAHATKEFMRWQPPEGVFDTLNRGPSHHRKSKTRLPQRNRTVTPMKPYGYPHETVEAKKRRNGYPHETVEAKKAASTVTPMKHTQLPGGDCGRLVPCSEGESAAVVIMTEPETLDIPRFLDLRPRTGRSA